MHDVEATTIRCDGCGVERAAKPGKHTAAKLPRDWKVLGGRRLCKTCRDSLYVMRAVPLPVSGAIDEETGQWVDPAVADFRAATFEAWGWATHASNVIVTELARNEHPVRGDQGVKLGPAPVLNSYESVRRMVPDMDPASVAALDQAVKGKYRKSRFNVFCRGVEALPTFRFPTPYPVRKDCWECVNRPSGERCIRVRFAGRWWLLKVVVDARQASRWSQLVTGEAERCEVSLVGRTVTESDDRPGLRLRVPGKPTPRTVRVMLKAVGWFPIREQGAAVPRVLHCKTGSDRLWTYRIGDTGEKRFFHADAVTALDAQQSRRLAEIDLMARSTRQTHERYLDRMAHDTKYEKRWPKRRRRKLLAGQDRRVRKFRDRMDSFTHLASKMLAEFARRNQITEVVYDDSDKAFSQRFPYAELRTRLAYKLDERGIAFRHVGSAGDTADTEHNPNE